MGEEEQSGAQVSFEDLLRQEPHIDLAALRDQVLQAQVEHVEAAVPVHKSMLRYTGLTCLGTIALGALAIYKGGAADTSFSILGANLKTTHVGVAMVGMGMIGLIW